MLPRNEECVQTAESRYLIPGKTREDLFKRLVEIFMEGESDLEKRGMYELLRQGYFCPATPILAHPFKGLEPISCFLASVGDSLASLDDTRSELLWLMANGGGTATDFSAVRSDEALVKHGNRSSGIIPFLNMYDAQTHAVRQGSVRRGAGAFYLRVDHPQVYEFLALRREGGHPARRAHDSHIGIKVSDDFMRAVGADKNIPLIDYDGTITRHVSARKLWFAILSERATTGEPYLYFEDNVNKLDTAYGTDYLPSQSNLCTEITMYTDPETTAVCCLGSFDVSRYAEAGYDAISSLHVELAILFLDNVLTVFEKIIEQKPDELKRHYRNVLNSLRKDRSIGIGVMGTHTAMQMKGLVYGSDEAIGWERSLFRAMSQDAKYGSKRLGDRRGVPEFAYHTGQRNTRIIAVAPTSTISLFCGGPSAGIDPLASNAFSVRSQNGSFVQENFVLKSRVSDRDWQRILANGGSVRGVIDSDYELYRTAYEIPQIQVINHAAARTPFIDQAQSTNLHFKDTASDEELHKVHWQAWKKGLKTLYYQRTQQDKINQQVCSLDMECQVCQ